MGRALMEEAYDYFRILQTSAARSAGAVKKMHCGFLTFSQGGLAAQLQGLADDIHAARESETVLLQHLHRAFITPIDRMDLYNVFESTLSLTAAAADAAQILYLCNIASMRREAVILSEKIRTSGRTLQILTDCFVRRRRDSGYWEQKVQTETALSESREAYHRCIRTLFLYGTGSETARWNRVYSEMEKCLHACENLKDRMTAAVLNNA